ncbi:hypothetical protein SAMN04488087_2670 [Rhodothermus profundi]|uniref:Uncharacterized protein n=1 Tax=Rhodothermus profundi TaxID=633813 RepID=A0A1M6XQH2_9BACT|nr:hypothetical protein SAMN04488087_2670 [Rhodothermus profundi]
MIFLRTIKNKYLITSFFVVFLIMALTSFFFKLFEHNFNLEEINIGSILFQSTVFSAKLLIFILGFFVLVIGSLKSRESIYISTLYLWIISGFALFVRGESFMNNPVSWIAFLLWLPFVFAILLLSKKYIKIKVDK